MNILKFKQFESNSKNDIFPSLQDVEEYFQDFIDEGFELDDFKVGSSLSIYPNTWCSCVHELKKVDGVKVSVATPNLDIKKNKTIKSLTIKFNSKQYQNYDLSILDILNKSINHFKSIYNFKLDSILVNVNLVNRGFVYRYSYFNSCETIKDLFILKDIEELPKNIEFTLTFDLT